MALIDKFAGKAPNKGLIAKYVGKQPKRGEKPIPGERAKDIE